MIIVAMGVCGCGKTTVGKALARSLAWPFHDADEFHPEANVRKMAAGVPLTDDDRAPWLEAIADAMRAILAQQRHGVFACSALKEVYRAQLRRAGDVRFVFLQGDQATIAARLANRRHRYMPASLLPSQFATLEVPTDALAIDIRLTIAAQVVAIRDALALTTTSS